MVEIRGYVMYSNMPPHKRVLWAKSVDAKQFLLIHGVGYSTVNEGLIEFKLVIFHHFDF